MKFQTMMNLRIVKGNKFYLYIYIHSEEIKKQNIEDIF